MCCSLILLQNMFLSIFKLISELFSQSRTKTYPFKLSLFLYLSNALSINRAYEVNLQFFKYKNKFIKHSFIVDTMLSP